MVKDEELDLDLRLFILRLFYHCHRSSHGWHLCESKLSEAKIKTKLPHKRMLKDDTLSHKV